MGDGGGHVKGRPGTSSLTGHPCHDMTWPLGDLPAVRGRSNVVQPCSSVPNGAAMMRPSSARGSEAASVEDAALPTREPAMSCLKVVSLEAQQPFGQEVNGRRIVEF